MNPETITKLQALLDDLRPEQQRAVTSGEKLVVVSAGAGTGKTRTLARRFAWKLATDPTCRVDQILTLTFTEKASREMAERIRSTLAEWYRRFPRELPHVRDALERLDDAYISTIHAFANRVIRESGLVLDVDPGAALVDRAQEEAWWNAFSEALETLEWDDALPLNDVWRDRAHALFEKNTLPHAEKAFSLVEAVNYYGPGRLSQMARQCGEVLGSCGRTPEELWDWDDANGTEDRILAWQKRLETVFEQAWDVWLGEILNASGSLDPGLWAKPGVFASKLLALGERFAQCEKSEANERAFLHELLTEALLSLPGKSKLKEAIEGVLGEPLTKWRDARRNDHALCGTFEPRERDLRSMLNRIAALGWAGWDASRKSRGLLSFRDLIRYAQEAILKNSAYADRFRHLLVDEFQDIDPLQDDLIRSIWREGRSCDLFIVGDIKQSIYRFRHADLACFARYVTRSCAVGNSDCEYVRLDKSYRAQGSLMDLTNDFFSDLWKKGVDAAGSTSFEPLTSPQNAPWWGERNAASPAPSMEALWVLKTKEEAKEPFPTAENMDGARRRLYEALAVRFRAWHEAGISVGDLVFDAASPEGRWISRPAKWSDFAILTPSRGIAYPYIEEAFERHGIDVVFSASQSYLSRGEVFDAVNLLALLGGSPGDPDEALLRAGWVMSPFSGMPPEASPSAELTEDATVHLNLLRATARTGGAASALAVLLREPDWLLRFPNGARRRVLANVRHIVDLARDYESAFGRDLHGCVAYLRRVLSGPESVDDPDIADESDDAVRVMTVHAAKGLEFPIVAVVGMEAASVRKASSWMVTKEMGVVANSFPPALLSADEALLAPKKRPRPLTAAWTETLENTAQFEERQRLLYVAMTRAREKLLFCGVLADADSVDDSPGDAESPKNWLAELRAWRRICAPNEPFPETFWGELGETVLETSEGCEAGKKYLEPLSLEYPADVALARVSASAYALFRWCPFAYRKRYRQGMELAWKGEGGVGGADLGTLAHWILERWDFDEESLARFFPADSSPGYETLLSRWPRPLAAVFKDVRSREALRGWLSVFSQSESAEMLRSLAIGGRLQRELLFRVSLSTREGPLLMGAIDLLWEDETRVYIRDWKTTFLERFPEALYDEQLRFYAFAWKCAHPGDMREVDAGVFALRKDEGYLPFVLNENDFCEIGKNVANMVIKAAQGPFEPTKKRCHECPWRGECNAGFL